MTDHSSYTNQATGKETDGLLDNKDKMFTCRDEEETDETLKQSSDLSSWLRQISVPVYLLVMIFAIASWIDINGLWVEVPLIVNILPEGWSLPSYMVIIIQIANVGPLAYMICQYVAPRHIKEWPVIYLILVVGAAMCILLAFFWRHTYVVLGQERSISLLVLSSFLALVDCTSSVVFLPYMALFKPQYMTAFYIGEGLSGLIPGIAGLIQGAGADPTCVNQTIYIYNSTTGINTTEYIITPHYSEPLFSIEAFFFFLFAIMCFSAAAFTCLHFLPMCQLEKVKTDQRNDAYTRPAEADKTHSNEEAEDGHIPNESSYGSVIAGSQDRVLVNRNLEETQDTILIVETDILPRNSYIILLVITGWVNCITNGVLPSIQSFSSLPYNNLVYTLTVRLSTVANPLACFLALFVRTRSLILLIVLTVLGTGLFGHQVVLAALSPSPPLQGHLIGEVLVVVSAVLLTGLLSYVKVMVASMLRDEGRRALMWCGGITQVGSLIGAVVAFLAVNVFNVFVSAPTCDGASY